MNGYCGAVFGQFCSGALGLPLGDLFALGILDKDEVTDGKIASGTSDVCSEEAFAGLGNGFLCVGTDGEGTAGFVLNGNPAFIGFYRLAVRDEVGAFFLAVEDCVEEYFVLPTANEDAAAGTVGNFSGGEFTDHSTDGGGLIGVFGHGFDFGADLLDDWYDFSAALFVDQAGDVGEDKEEVGTHDAGDKCGEGIVVAELNFSGADGVVFVDDGDDTAGEESFDGFEDGVVPVFGAEVFAGQEDLCDGQFVWVESALPVIDQDALANGGAGLELGQFFGALVEAELTHAQADGSGADEDDFNASGTECCYLATESSDALGIEFSDAGGKDAGADFDDDAPSLFEWDQVD